MDLAKSKLTRNILIGLAVGIACGLALSQLIEFQTNEAGEFLRDANGRKILADGFLETQVVGGLLTFLGDIFIRALTMIVAPLVFVSLVCGTAAMNDIRKLGTVGLKTLALYLLTTCLAISLGIALALIVKPGAGVNLTVASSYAPTEAESIFDVLADIVPSNLVSAFASSDMLQIIFAAAIFGLAIVVSGSKGQPVLRFFEGLNEVIMNAVILIMFYAPIGVFAKIALVFATEGFDTILALSKYFGLVAVTLVVHAAVVYPSMLKLLGRLSPVAFLRKFREAQLFAFSTASSNATIPVTLRSLEDRLGVDNKIASFTVPLGATINMDGTAIMQGVATVFIAQYAGVDLSFAQILTVIFTATIASVGTAGVPSAGLVMLVIVLNQVGLPVEHIGMIVGIDRLLDMLRTAVNVTGDAVVTCIVAKSEGQLDQARYDDPDA